MPVRSLLDGDGDGSCTHAMDARGSLNQCAFVVAFHACVHDTGERGIHMDQTTGVQQELEYTPELGCVHHMWR